MIVQKEQSHYHAKHKTHYKHTQKKNCKCCAISSDVCLEGRSWQQEAEMASSYVALFKAKNVINEQNLAGTYYTDKFHLKVILTFLVEKSA